MTETQRLWSYNSQHTNSQSNAVTECGEAVDDAADAKPPAGDDDDNAEDDLDGGDEGNEAVDDQLDNRWPVVTHVG